MPQIIHAFNNAVPDVTGTFTGFNSQGSTTTIAATNIVRPSDWNSAHNQLYTIIGNTNSDSTGSGSNIVLSGGNNITLIGSGSVIGISAPSQPLFSSWANVPFVQGTQTLKPTQSTFYVFPLRIEEDITFDKMRFLSTISIASTSFASTANTTFSFNHQETNRWVLYGRNTGASSMSLYSITSDSFSIRWSANVVYGSASNTSQGNTFGLTWQDSGGTSSFSTAYSTSNVSTIAVSTGNLTRLTGAKYANAPFASSLTAGEYWLAINHSTSSTTQGTNLSGIRYRNSILAISQINNAIGDLGLVNVNTQGFYLGKGSFTTVGGASTASLGFSNVSTSASYPIPVVTFGHGLA